MPGVEQSGNQDAGYNPIADEWITAMKPTKPSMDGGLEPILDVDEEEGEVVSEHVAETNREPQSVEEEPEDFSEKVGKKLKYQELDAEWAMKLAEKHNFSQEKKDEAFIKWQRAKREYEEYLEKFQRNGQSPDYDYNQAQVQESFEDPGSIEETTSSESAANLGNDGGLSGDVIS